MSTDTTDEPAAWRYKDTGGHWRYVGSKPDAYCVPLLKPEPLYAAPQLLTLSDEQITALARDAGDEHKHSFIMNKDGRYSVLTFARAVLAAAQEPRP